MVLLLLLLLLLMVLMLSQQNGRLLELSLLQGGSRRLLILAAGSIVVAGCTASAVRRCLGRNQLGVVRGHRAVVVARLLGVVHEVAPGPVRAEPDAVERAAQLGFVLWMTLEVAQFLHPVRKLALVAVLALARLLERPAQLGFVSGRVDLLGERFRLGAL